MILVSAKIMKNLSRKIELRARTKAVLIRAIEAIDALSDTPVYPELEDFARFVRVVKVFQDFVSDHVFRDIVGIWKMKQYRKCVGILVMRKKSGHT